MLAGGIKGPEQQLVLEGGTSGQKARPAKEATTITAENRKRVRKRACALGEMQQGRHRQTKSKDLTAASCNMGKRAVS